MGNSKFSLVIPMLSLTPMLATALEPDAGDFVAKHSEYVSIRPATTVEPPALRDSGRISPLLADAPQTFYRGSLTGSSIPYPLPSPPELLDAVLHPSAAQALVPASTPWSQAFGYTTNSADLTGAAKTCVWQVNVSVANGVCTANVTTTAYGTQGVVCLLDTTNSGVAPNTCQLVVGVGLQ